MAGVNKNYTIDGFKSKAEVLRWLEDHDREISKTQFYDHCREGLLRKSRVKKVFTLKAVEKYAKTHTRDASTGEKERDHQDKLNQEKLELEVRRERVKLEKDEHDLATRRGKFIARSDHELEVAARAVAFMAHLKHTIQMRVPDYIDLVNGDHHQAALLVNELTNDIEQRMATFAGPSSEFDIILEAER